MSRLLAVLAASIVLWAASGGALGQAPSTTTTSTSTTYQWRDYATFVGGITKHIDLSWQIDTAAGAMPQFYEVKGTWLERPTQNKFWKLMPNQVAVVTGTSPNLRRVSVRMRLPGTGHFSFEQRNCLNPVPPATTPTCTPWANSLDPAVAQVNGQAKKWWVYGYLEPLPAPAPVSAPQVLPPQQQTAALTWSDP